MKWLHIFTLNISRNYLSIKRLQCYEMTRRYCKNRKSVSLANVYSCFGSISNAFYLYMVTARACSSTPHHAHVHSTSRCGYRVRLSAPCSTDLYFYAGFTFDLPCLPLLSELQMCTDKGTARILNYRIPKLAMLTLRVHYDPLNSN